MSNQRIPFEPGKYYHVYNHGNGDDNIFKSEGNYLYFLQKYSQYLNPISETYAYCLMPNHFHFLIRIKSNESLLEYFKIKYPAKNPQGLQDLAGLVSRQWGNFLNSYVKAFNIQQSRIGSLFRDNVNRKSVTNKSYFIKLIHYIHYNPVHHNFVKSIEDWPYSSYHSFLSAKNTKLEKAQVVKWFGNAEAFKETHKSIPDRNLFLDMEF